MNITSFAAFAVISYPAKLINDLLLNASLGSVLSEMPTISTA
jgi:hypothetical protein